MIHRKKREVAHK